MSESVLSGVSGKGISSKSYIGSDITLMRISKFKCLIPIPEVLVDPSPNSELS